ncbi:MAG: SDR family NAD(P)-dependent oxidoreductase, partial [Gammaproteobacteria bacterium]|nr:SDR family NAD(P)-dependent oxidoreductase [Gammaproteobacteria bacterium]
MSEPSHDLTGKTVIVTGGGTGIGKVYSESLASAGANVVIADLAAEEGQMVADEISKSGGSALSIGTDISSENATARMAQAAIDAFGRIDGLINNASMMSVLARRTWYEIDVDEWDQVMAVNL